MNTVFRFLGSSTGRIIRIVAGLVLVIIGFLIINTTAGWILVIIGLVPLLAGVIDKCVFAPLFKLPFDGSKLRQALENKSE